MVTGATPLAAPWPVPPAPRSVTGASFSLVPDEQPGQLGSLPYWGVDDIQAEYQRLLKLGATVVEAPMDVGEKIMVATVADPWGNHIGLIFNPHFRVEAVR